MTKTERVKAFFQDTEGAATLSNGEVARRLGVSRTLVSVTRRELGIEAPYRQARLNDKLVWMHTDTIGKRGLAADLERLRARVGAAWIEFEGMADPAVTSTTVINEAFSLLHTELGAYLRQCSSGG